MAGKVKSAFERLLILNGKKEYYKNRKGSLLRMKKETNCSDARFAPAIVATIRL